MPASFLDCVFNHLRDVQKIKFMVPGPVLRFLGSSNGPRRPFEDQWRPTSRRHLLSVSVESAMVCPMRVYDVVCVVSLSGAVCHLCADTIAAKLITVLTRYRPIVLELI